MSNVLSEEEQKQIIALGQLGWSLRRIQKETGIRRETVAAYLKAAGIPIRPPGAWGKRHLSRRRGGAGELESRVERALAALAPRHREVLLLLLVEEMTQAEMAEVCGVTPEAWRQRISRARAMLARELDSDEARQTRPRLREVTA